MIQTEYYITRKDGVILIRTYSDINMKICSDETNELYDDAVDPEYLNRTYTETDISIERSEVENVNNL